MIVRLGHEPVVHDGADERIADVDAAVVDPDGAGIVIAQRLRARRVPSVFTSIFPPERDTLDLEPVAYLCEAVPAVRSGACRHCGRGRGAGPLPELTANSPDRGRQNVRGPLSYAAERGLACRL